MGLCISFDITSKGKEIDGYSQGAMPVKLGGGLNMSGYYGEGKRWARAHYRQLAARDAQAIMKHGLALGLEPGRGNDWKVSYYDSIGDYDAAAYWYYNG